MPTYHCHMSAFSLTHSPSRLLSLCPPHPHPVISLVPACAGWMPLVSVIKKKSPKVIKNIPFNTITVFLLHTFIRATRMTVIEVHCYQLTSI